MKRTPLFSYEGETREEKIKDWAEAIAGGIFLAAFCVAACVVGAYLAFPTPPGQ